MADETTPPTEAGTEAQEPKKGKLPVLGGAAAGLAIGAVVGLFVLGPKLAPASPAAASAKHEKKKEEKGEEGEGKKTDLSVYQLDNLVLNPAGSNGTRFLLLSVALEVKDEASVAIVKAHDAEMRDMVLRLFGSKTAEAVSEASAREGLRTELRNSLNAMFPAGTIKKVYFPQFVIQ